MVRRNFEDLLAANRYVVPGQCRRMLIDDLFRSQKDGHICRLWSTYWHSDEHVPLLAIITYWDTQLRLFDFNETPNFGQRHSVWNKKLIKLLHFVQILYLPDLSPQPTAVRISQAEELFDTLFIRG